MESISTVQCTPLFSAFIKKNFFFSFEIRSLVELYTETCKIRTVRLKGYTMNKGSEDNINYYLHSLTML